MIEVASLCASCRYHFW